MTRSVLMAEVSGGRVRGRPRLGWMDGAKVALGNKGMAVEAARQCAKDKQTNNNDLLEKDGGINNCIYKN